MTKGGTQGHLLASTRPPSDGVSKVFRGRQSCPDPLAFASLLLLLLLLLLVLMVALQQLSKVKNFENS